MGTTRKLYNVLILRILIIFLIVFSILFVLQWHYLEESIKDGSEKRIELINSLKNTKTNFIDITKLSKDSLKIVLDRKDVEDINMRINSLATEIYSEKNKAETIVDKDIDRLNLYMAIGIGFIAILGVFVPFLVNTLSNDDLKRKQENLISDLNENNAEIVEIQKNVNSTKEKFDLINIKEIDEAVKKSKEIENLKGRTEELLPKISVISFQIAIHRLFNVSPLAISKISRTNDNSLFKELFENVKIELELCLKNNTLIIEENGGIQQTLKDFSKMLIQEDYKFQTFLKTRKIISEFEELSDKMKELAESKKDQQEYKYEKVEETFEAFIIKIDELNA